MRVYPPPRPEPESPGRSLLSGALAVLVLLVVEWEAWKARRR